MTLEEVNSQIALEYGQAMTVKVVKADGEIMRKSLHFWISYVFVFHIFSLVIKFVSLMLPAVVVY